MLTMDSGRALTILVLVLQPLFGFCFVDMLMMDNTNTAAKANNALMNRDIPTSCDICDTDCAFCNDACFSNFTGECARCWEDQGGYACLSMNATQIPNCFTCWYEKPCVICDTGSCARCADCKHDKTGECASCWEDEHAMWGGPCLSTSTGGCQQGCWNSTGSAPPLLYIPGFTSSSINASYSKKHFPLCLGTEPPTSLWPLSASSLNSTAAAMCYLSVTRTIYDDAKGTFHPPAGVNISTFDFGGMSGFNFGPGLTPFLRKFGWVEGKNLFGAPFDWRQGSCGLESYYIQLRLLIEKIFDERNQKVNLLAISYGPQIALGFLHRMSSAWKDKHIDWFMAEAPLWSGVPLMTYAITTGLPLAGFPPSMSRDLALACPGLLWIQPITGADQYTYGKNETIMSTPRKNYTAWDTVELLKDLGLESFVPQYKFMQSQADLTQLAAPLVNTFVTYGYGINTSVSFEYAAEFKKSRQSIPYPIKVVSASGDGLVPLKSALRSTLWQSEQDLGKKTILHKGYEGLAHGGCLFGDPTSHTQSCFSDVLSLMLEGKIPTGTH